MDRCEDIKSKIDIAFGEQHNFPDEIQNHLNECPECSAYFEKSKQLSVLFKTGKKLNADYSDHTEFKNSLKPKLEKALNNRERKLTVHSNPYNKIKHVFAVAAAVLLLLGTVIFFENSSKIDFPNNGTLISKTEANKGEPVKITLEYEASEAMKNVNIEFNLDKGISFDSSSEKIRSLKNFIWKGDLKKGKNEIPFVVTVDKKGVWNIDTNAIFSRYSHRHKIIIDARYEKIVIAQYELPREPADTI